MTDLIPVIRTHLAELPPSARVKVLLAPEDHDRLRPRLNDTLPLPVAEVSFWRDRTIPRGCYGLRVTD